MKKLVFGFMAIFAFSNLVSAQEDPEKALKKADNALVAYLQNLDPSAGDAKIKEAVELIEFAAAADINKGKVKTWQTRGEIYNALSDVDLTTLFKDPQAVPKNPNAPLIAAESFMKAIELATKKFETKDAIKGMTESSGKLNNIGNNQIKRNDYAGAYKSLEMVMKINDVVKKNGSEPIITDADMTNHKYVVAFCAASSGDKAMALKYFKELYDAGSNEPAVFSQYFDMLYQAGNKDEAWKVFNQGQSKFPTSTEILFAGINAKIAEQDYEALKKMLNSAIEAEPNNPSIYSALGNVYMNLFNVEYAKDKDSAVAKGYFDEALKYFNKAIELDPKQFDATYSIGSLYFNKAVELIKQANSLGMDKESQKKYKAMTDESASLMTTALPYFQKTEALQPNDINTLIALTEIYARMNDLEKSKEFKTRQEKAKAGQDVGPAYFKN
jgi:tetratricopeptide (TPR) repeat protein